MKKPFDCRHLWRVSLVVGGLALSACSDENTFFSWAARVNAAGSEQTEHEFPVAIDPHLLTRGMEEELRGCFDFFWNE